MIAYFECVKSWKYKFYVKIAQNTEGVYYKKKQLPTDNCFLKRRIDSPICYLFYFKSNLTGKV